MMASYVVAIEVVVCQCYQKSVLQPSSTAATTRADADANHEADKLLLLT
jgi:hypothetical protein